MSLEIRGKTLKLASGNTIGFKFRILEAVPIGGVVIVRIEVPVKRVLNENVYGVSADGEILWQIKPVTHLIGNSPYVGISEVGNRARLFNADGMVYDINPSTGSVETSYFGK